VPAVSFAAEEIWMSEAIVVGTDGSATAKRAVAEAVRLASALDAEVHIVSAHEPLRGVAAAGAAGYILPPVGDDALEPTLTEAADAVRAANVRVQTHAVHGSPADALVQIAEQVGASLIVVGNQGMHGAKRVLGSVPNSVSHRARCNVLIVSTDAD
jgi:nucleotide-binding universal stress UspA family protein